MKESRTIKSIKNAKIALVFYFLNLVLSFISRKVFIDYLGAEILGLNTTVVNLLSFLNLAELGIGSAIAYTLYKPLSTKSTNEINEIVSIQGWLYRVIAYIVIVAACILMCFFPLIFEKTELPLWYAFSTFIVLLISSLLGYFTNYKQIVLTANQKEYKVIFCVQGIKVVKVIFQVIAISYFDNGYIYWLLIECSAAFIVAYVLNIIVKKEYPWLQTNPKLGKSVRNKYPEIIIKTKQLFLHKIAGFVLGQTSPLIIYAYSSLTLVAVYGNYLLIVTGISVFINSLFSSMTAGVGNLVAECNSVKVQSVFWELYSFRIWISSVVCFGVYELSASFVSLWLGHEYVLSTIPFVLIVVYAFISLTRIVDIFLAAYGLYQDIWAPVAEATLNLGLSILLGYYYGLSGILSGVIVSLFIIVLIWKPYFLFRYGFKESSKKYWLNYLKYIFLILLSFLFSIMIKNIVVDIDPEISYLFWIKYAVQIILIYMCISGLFFYVGSMGMRQFANRLILFFRSKY